MRKNERLPASFRDPSGFLFKQGEKLYRQVNTSYRPIFDHLQSCGLYETLIQADLLVPAPVVDVAPAEPKLGDLVIQPELLPFISYPYEWSFSQLKDAALTTLRIQKKALEYGMILKDASAFNVQFHPITCRPILIDTLSFDMYNDGKPWDGYRQFCQQFLAPIALIATKDAHLGRLSTLYIDGIPLDLCSKLLPGRTRLNIGLLTHIHMHAAAQKRYAGKPIEVETRTTKIRKQSLLGLLDNLERTIERFTWDPSQTEWTDYVRDHNYSQAALADKKEWVEARLKEIAPATVWDLGANTGTFSRIAANLGIRTLAFDLDPGAVERNYLKVRENHETNILPLIMDLTNPSPDIGWENRERDSLLKRGPAGAVIALALIHHLAIGNNVPLPSAAAFFAGLSAHLLIEFVPKTDSQVQRLLASREDIFPDYTEEGFEAAFGDCFKISAKHPIAESERVLYQMRRR